MVYNSRSHRGLLNFILAVLPAMLLFCVFSIYPILTSFYYSFTNYDGLTTMMQWVGLENYKYLFTGDSAMSAALKNNLIWAFFLIVVHNVAALIIAILIDQKIRFRNFYRSVFFVPVVMSSVAVSFIWSFIYDPNNGSLNAFFHALGLDVFVADWLGSYDLAIYSTMFVESWKTIGFNILLFLAGLQVVPADLLEASVVDGASRWQKFWNITFPILLPTTGLVIVLSANAAFRAFDMVFLLTKGGPGDTTQLIMYRAYVEAFENTSFGYASAISWIIFAVLLFLAWLQLRLTRNEGA